jgi:hypothetical protein
LRPKLLPAPDKLQNALATAEPCFRTGRRRISQGPSGAALPTEIHFGNLFQNILDAPESIVI